MRTVEKPMTKKQSEEVDFLDFGSVQPTKTDNKTEDFLDFFDEIKDTKVTKDTQGTNGQTKE